MTVLELVAMTVLSPVVWMVAFGAHETRRVLRERHARKLRTRIAELEEELRLIGERYASNLDWAKEQIAFVAGQRDALRAEVERLAGRLRVAEVVRDTAIDCGKAIVARSAAWHGPMSPGVDRDDYNDDEAEKATQASGPRAEGAGAYTDEEPKP